MFVSPTIPPGNAGGVVCKEPQGRRAGGVRTLGEVLYDLRLVLDQRWRRFLSLLPTEPLGLNLPGMTYRTSRLKSLAQRFYSTPDSGETCVAAPVGAVHRSRVALRYSRVHDLGRSRQTLDWASPSEKFAEAVAMTA